MVPEYQDADIREVLEAQYRVIYEVTAKEIQLLAVIHAARRWNGRSCQRSECCGARCCALKGLGQISLGQSVAPPPVVVAMDFPIDPHPPKPL